MVFELEDNRQAVAWFLREAMGKLPVTDSLEPVATNAPHKGKYAVRPIDVGHSVTQFEISLVYILLLY